VYPHQLPLVLSFTLLIVDNKMQQTENTISDMLEKETEFLASLEQGGKGTTRTFEWVQEISAQYSDADIARMIDDKPLDRNNGRQWVVYMMMLIAARSSNSELLSMLRMHVDYTYPESNCHETGIMRRTFEGLLSGRKSWAYSHWARSLFWIYFEAVHFKS
jgi:hypothetical protein